MSIKNIRSAPIEFNKKSLSLFLLTALTFYPVKAMADVQLVTVQSEMPKELREIMGSVIGEADDPARSLAQARRRAEKAAEKALSVLRSQGYYGGKVQACIDEFIMDADGGKQRPPEEILKITPGPL